MHVTDPKRFPISASAAYTPHSATLSEALKNASNLKIPNLVFVQPSTYGTDNACLLDALARVGPEHGRGIVVFDPTKTELSTLRKWHALGVRGVRVNLNSPGSKKYEPAALLEQLAKYVNAVRPLRTWTLQLYIDMATIPQLESVVAELDGVKLVLDHLGAPRELKRPLSDMRGWDGLEKLMRRPDVFVKISAPYRISEDPHYRDLERLTKEFFSIRGGDGVVFASDWPHTRFEGVDVRPWVDRCLEWCGENESMGEKLFKDNAKQLWDIK